MDELVGCGMVALSGLRIPYVREVTAVDQGPTAATDRRIPKKADQGKKRIGDKNSYLYKRTN